MPLTARRSPTWSPSVVLARRRIAPVVGALVLSLAGAACGGYSGPPDIETARQGLRPEYRIVYDGEDGKDVLELLVENAENVVTEGQGDELLVTAVNGIEGGVEGRYWLYYVNEQAGLIAASRLETVEGDSIEWLFVR